MRDKSAKILTGYCHLIHHFEFELYLSCSDMKDGHISKINHLKRMILYEFC